jgi:PhnB protein
MSNRVNFQPAEYHTITPAIIVRDPDAAMEFYKKVFGAEQTTMLRMPDGKVMHAEFRIGDSRIMMAAEFPDYGMKAPVPGHNSSSLNLYVTDVDAVFKRAVDAGATALMPPADMFWGDRYSKVADPFGHTWGIATHIEDVSDEECARRAAQWKPEC